ncbi:putative phage abortive infection protein [uncultured Vibrio sp.]|uniref:putative phage abortive infection protein n=1 Tax=uncultured Vibrio sp. TaxID=114054 RepID=UPI00260EBF4B|nr:putative phage abortive infection protein [uncultured Vibrio sp.]
MKESFLERYLSVLTIGLAILSATLSIGVLCLYSEQFGSNLSVEHEVWAQFGDYIGGTLGSVFAFFALIALLMTLRLQSTELEKSSRELKNSASALSEQSKAIKIQNFENRLFNMLSLHHDIVNAIDLRKDGNVTTSGRDCFKVFCNRLIQQLKPAIRGDHMPYEKGLLIEYEKFYHKHSHELAHYFRFVYRILKFIDDNNIGDKQEYSGVFRAQLSNPELALLFYNGLSKRGEKFKSLAERYAFFEHLELPNFLNTEIDYKLYNSEAFGEQLTP